MKPLHIEDLRELAGQIVMDQADWVAASMMKLVPPSLHQFITYEVRNPDKLDKRLKQFMNMNGIQLAWMGLAESKKIPCPMITVSGEPVGEYKCRIRIPTDSGRMLDAIKYINGDPEPWAD